MIAALSGSTALLVIAVFQALLAGNGRLIDASTPIFVAVLAVVVAFVGPADDEVAAAVGLGVALIDDDVSVGVDEDSAPRLSCASAPCAGAWVQAPTTSTTAVAAPSSTRSRGRLTRAGWQQG